MSVAVATGLPLAGLSGAGAVAGAATTTTTAAKATTTTAKPRSTTTTAPKGPSSNRTFLRANCGSTSGRQVTLASAPMAVTQGKSGSVLRVGVCIGSSGPYPFVVATGVTTSVIDPSLASKLGMKRAGSQPLGGSGCTLRAPLVKVPSMHVARIALAGQPMAAVRTKSWDGVAASGILGSDVLGRFGAVRLDFARGLLTVPGPEGPAPRGHFLLNGTAGATPPTSLVKGTPTEVVPITVTQGPGSIAAYTRVSIGTLGPYAFIVDSGAPTTGLAASLLQVLSITPTSQTAPAVGVGCIRPTGIVQGATPMSLGSTTLPVTTPRAVRFLGLQRVGIQGALGLDGLGSFKSIVLDYRGGDLALGTG